MENNFSREVRKFTILFTNISEIFSSNHNHAMQHRSSTRVLTWMRARSEVSFRLATIQSSLMDFSSLLILFSSIELCHCRLRYFFSFVGFRLLLFSQWVHEHNNKKRLYEEWQALLAIFIINNNNAYWVFHLTRNRDDVSNYRKNLEGYCTVFFL